MDVRDDPAYWGGGRCAGTGVAFNVLSLLQSIIGSAHVLSCSEHVTKIHI